MQVNGRLKPAYEPVILARKPLSEKTVAENVLKWSTGAINIDGCRVGYTSEADKLSATPQGKCTSKGVAIGASPDTGRNLERIEFERPEQKGRWPANLIHDGSDEVLECFPNNNIGCKPHKVKSNIEKYDGYETITKKTGEIIGYNDGDDKSVARFFYCAKASKSERESGCKNLTIKADGSLLTGSRNPRNTTAKNHHPTVKPLKLLEYLCKLITSPKGIILDPFAGSGTTGIAAKNLGFNFI